MRKKAKTSVLSLLLALVMVLGLSPGTAWAAESEVIEIGTAEELAAFRETVNNGQKDLSAKLTANIQLTGEWTPFNPSSGYVTDAYTGTFDGAGHTISGMNINDSSTNGVGFFGTVNGAAIQNLCVEGTITASNSSFVGGIVGKTQGAVTITNCSFSGTVNSGKDGSNAGAGGIVGRVNAGTVAITGCANSANISGGVAGGILGYCSQKGNSINDCYNTGNITAIGTYPKGGIAGQVHSSALIKTCYTTVGTTCGKNGVIDTCFDESTPLTDPGTLGGAFTTDAAGNVILSWQAGAAPAPREPKITISGSKELYMTNSGTQPAGTLRVDYTDMDPTPVKWSITKGEDVIALIDPTDVDANKSTQTVSIQKSGKAAVKAVTEDGTYSDEIEITVWPFVTTVEIEGAVAVGETVTARINIYGGGEPDYNLFPVTVQWKYLTCEDYSAGSTSSSSYKTIPGAANREFTIPANMEGDYLSFTVRYGNEEKTPSRPTQILAKAPEEPDPQPPVTGKTPEEVLEGYAMHPVFGQDTNVNRMLEAYLAEKGFDGYTASVKSVAEVYGGAGIAENGDITYFYADPNTTPAIKFGSYRAVFTLSNGEAALDREVPVIVCWDADKVKAAMASEILSEVTLDAEASADLSLPKAVDGKHWALISWQSSDEEVISISGKNQSAADTLFEPFTGVVKRGEKHQTVTLTATFTFQLTNDVTGGEKPITMLKTFTVTVPPMGDEETAAIRAGLLAKLDAGFEKAGLTDAVTGERLTADENGVYTAANDIQLPTPRDFGVDGKYCPVTITAGSGEVLKAPDVNNAARVEVCRPIGADGAGTITVTLHDRDTSVTASKAFNIRVTALSQEEISAELALMERVKAAYFDGIKGGNGAKDNVRTNLSPFFEVYADKNGELVWVRSNGEQTGRGIVPVPMEGWEELELWRLFKSSNPNVISHENLIVTRQAEAKAVTITSRLSSETLGRYGELYVENPEKYPQYEALAPLYCQEVTTDTSIQPAARRTARAAAQTPVDTIVVRGTRDPESAVPVIETLDSITFSITGLDGVEWASASLSGLDEASTVYDAFLEVLGPRYTAERVKGTYIKSISGPQGSLAEKEYGEYSGWMYRVNGSIPDVYMGACPLHSGDVIQMFYTRDARQDDPNYSRPSGGNSGGSSDGGSSAGKTETENRQAATVERSNRGDTYTVTLPKSGGPQRVIIPDVKQGQLVVIVHADGREEVIKKSILEDSCARFLLEQDADVRVIDYANPFADIAGSAWYSSAVDFVSGRKLFSGVGENTFAPDLSLSRGMLAAVLYRLEEPDAQSTSSLFSDVAAGAWYEREAAWAAQAGIVHGYGDGRFGPEDAITREQLAVMLFRYAQLLNMNTAGRDSLTGFSDSAAVSPWARGAVAWAVDSGIISGLPNGTLSPSGTATRAEAAAMLQRFIRALLK